VTPTQAEQLIDLVEKYGRFFGLGDHELPDLEIKDNLGSKWLARVEWSPRTPNTSLLQIQKVALKDERTLERIVAHEMIHVHNFMRMTDAERAYLKLRRSSLSDDHGTKFRELAERVNAEMGADFVTERSDQDYELAENERPFFVLIQKLGSGKLGWTWAAKLSPQMEKEIEKRKLEDSAILVESTDRRFTKGAKIKKYGGCSVPRSGSDDEGALLELYEEAVGGRRWALGCRLTPKA